jgi:hypothetical protein
MSNPKEQLSPADQADAEELIGILSHLKPESRVIGDTVKTIAEIIEEIRNGTPTGLLLLRGHQDVMRRNRRKK